MASGGYRGAGRRWDNHRGVGEKSLPANLEATTAGGAEMTLGSALHGEPRRTTNLASAARGGLRIGPPPPHRRPKAVVVGVGRQRVRLEAFDGDGPR
jgi:hypothetical protein